MAGPRRGTLGLLRSVTALIMLVALGAVAGGASALAAYRFTSAGTEYDASLVLAAENPEAYGMVPTYAALVPEDERLLTSVAETLGTDTQDVSSRLSANPLQQTTVMQIDYRGSSAAEARRALDAVQLALTDTDRPGPLGQARFYVVRDVQTTVVGGLGRNGILLLGVLMGAAIGFGAGLLLRQTRPRAWTPSTLSRSLGDVPVTRVASAEDLAAFLTTASASGEAVPVALGAMPDRLLQDLEQAAARPVVVADPLDSALPAGVAGASRLYLVIRRGTPLWHVRRWVGQLRTGERELVFAALVEPPTRRAPEDAPARA